MDLKKTPMELGHSSSDIWVKMQGEPTGDVYRYEDAKGIRYQANGPALKWLQVNWLTAEEQAAEDERLALERAAEQAKRAAEIAKEKAYRWVDPGGATYSKIGGGASRPRDTVRPCRKSGRYWQNFRSLTLSKRPAFPWINWMTCLFWSKPSTLEG